MDVTVVVGTFGDESWVTLAQQRALPSAHGVKTILSYADTLQNARNLGLAQVETEWVCHLDADDELEPGYFEAMERSTADVRVPSVRYVKPHRQGWPIMPRVSGHDHRCKADCLAEGNWIVVGAVVRAELVRSVGGWRDFPLYEDWDLWVRCWQAGASIEEVTKAVYRAHVRSDSRNRSPSRAKMLAAHQAIARANGLPVPV